MVMVMTISWEDHWVKKLGKILLFFCLFSSLLCGCQKEDVADGEFVATMESSGGDTKSYISQKHNCWEASDIVYVNGAPAKEFQLDAELGKAHFKPAERAESYRMFTFGGQEFTWNNDNTITFSLPQDYSGQDMPMYATTEDFGPVVFHNLFSVIHFYNIPTTGTNTIRVTAASSYISGSFTFNFATDTFTGGSSKTRTFTPETGTTEAWMVIPATSAQNIDVQITNWGDNYKMTKTSVAISPNTIIGVDYNKLSDCKLVSSASQLASFLNNSASTDDVYIRITDDFSFEDFGYFQQPPRYFRKTIKIDGQGYSITLNKPIYEHLYSTVKVYNLTLTGNFPQDFSAGLHTYNYAFAEVHYLGGSVSATNCVSTVTKEGKLGYLPFSR